LIQGLP